MPEADDWRRQGQERYLLEKTLVWRSWSRPSERWDHDHCEFCHVKFMEPGEEDVLTAGFATEDGRWICGPCFEDFREEFRWAIGKGNGP